MPSLAERSLRVAMTGAVPADDPTVIADMQNKINALREALRGHQCPVDSAMMVARCVDGKWCGCTNGLLLDVDR